MFNTSRGATTRLSGTTLSFGTASEVGPLSSRPSYDTSDVDPWGSASMPPPAPPPAYTTPFDSIISESELPQAYHQTWAAADQARQGDVSVNTLHRVLAASNLPASQIEKIVNLTASRARVSKLELCVALALTAFAQQGQEPSIEAVIAHKHALPLPTLDRAAVAQASSAFATPAPRAPLRGGTLDSDPWNTTSGVNGAVPVAASNHFGIEFGQEADDPPAAGAGEGETWKGVVETVQVQLRAEKEGFILKHHVFTLESSSRTSPVSRRYSDFDWFLDILRSRYPFRLLPLLPPKRLTVSGHTLSADPTFLENRRRGLQRFINFVVNHPTLKQDGVVKTFMEEPNLEQWRKSTQVSHEEEAISKRLDRNAEMSIPVDLEERLSTIKSSLPAVIESWQRLCALLERIARRREADAADWARFGVTARGLAEADGEAWRRAEGDSVRGIVEVLGQRAGEHAEAVEERAAKMILGIVEDFKRQRDLYVSFSALLQRHERLSPDSVERLKKRIETSQRKLDALRNQPPPSSSTASSSPPGAGAAAPPASAAEVDKYLTEIERDQAEIAVLLSRRVYGRWCLWAELAFVLQRQEGVLLQQTARDFAGAEAAWVRELGRGWEALEEGLERLAM